MGWDFKAGQELFGVRAACSAGLLLASGALFAGCGLTRTDDAAFGNGGAGGESALGKDAGSDESAGRGGAANASAGRAGSNAKGATGGSGSSGSGTTGGGGNFAGGAGAASNLPLDTRTARPAWTPPFAVGTPGWRASSEALCEKQQGDQEAFDVWADSRGVFGLFATTCNVLAGTACGKQGVSLQFNDGTGWQSLYAVPPGPGMGSSGGMHLSGFDAGPLLLSGSLANQLGIWRVTLDGQAGLDAALEVGRPFTVGSNLAYALGPDTLYRFADDKWSAYLMLPAPVQSLWADKDRIVIVGPDQALYEKRTTYAEFVAIPDVPAGNYSAVWSFGGVDLWLGNQIGQLVHYDGTKWTVFETGSKDVTGSGIVQLWGSNDGQLFFRTYGELGRYDGSTLKLLLEVPAGDDPSRLRVVTGGMWGLSSKEVFFSVTDRQFNEYACGGQFMLFFDGSAFHSF